MGRNPQDSGRGELWKIMYNYRIQQLGLIYQEQRMFFGNWVFWKKVYLLRTNYGLQYLSMMIIIINFCTVLILSTGCSLNKFEKYSLAHFKMKIKPCFNIFLRNNGFPRMSVSVMTLVASIVSPNSLWNILCFVNGMLPNQILKVHFHTILVKLRVPFWIF